MSMYGEEWIEAFLSLKKCQSVEMPNCQNILTIKHFII